MDSKARDPYGDDEDWMTFQLASAHGLQAPPSSRSGASSRELWGLRATLFTQMHPDEAVTQETLGCCCWASFRGEASRERGGFLSAPPGCGFRFKNKK